MSDAVGKQAKKTAPSTVSRDFQRLIRETGRYLLAGRVAEAEATCRRALKLKPNRAEGHYHLGVALASQLRFSEAIPHYQRATALEPNYFEAHNNLGLALAAIGRRDEAIVQFESALVINPEFTESHNNLGVALMQQGRFDFAAQHYESALRIDPAHLTARNNLGHLLLEQNKPVEAVALFNTVLSLDPYNIQANINIGAALAKADRRDEAIACFQRVLARDPNHCEALSNLGAACNRQGRAEEALAYFDRALAHTPGNVMARVNRGIALAELGRFDEAMAEYVRALALDPSNAEAHYHRTSLKSYHATAEDIAAMEALAGRDSLTPARAATIHFALGSTLDRKGDYQRAFEHLRRANDLKRRLFPYDEPATLGSFRKIAGAFNRDYFETLEKAGNPSTLPVFVLGMPRSGSTLVEQILASHPRIHGANELTALYRAAAKVLRGKGTGIEDWVPSADAAREIAETYLSLLPVLPEGKIRVVDKLPGNFLMIGLIRTVFPSARIIHTLRNPADTCLSCYSTSFASGQDFSHDLGELGRYYRGYAQLMTYWRSVLPPGAMLDVVYEDVVNDLEGQARRMIDYCGLVWDDRCLQFHQTNRQVRTAGAIQVCQPLFRDSLQRWRKYETELGQLLHELGDLAPHS